MELDENMICSICLSAQQDPIKLEKCAHQYCKDCITQWLDIKNNCPMCLNLIGSEPHNHLLNIPPENVEFDNGVLEFQAELKAVNQNMQYLQGRINVKSAQSKNFKNQFRQSSLNYIQDQMLAVKNFYSLLEEAIFLNDRANTGVYLQTVTQMLLDIENVLQGGPIGRMNEEEYFSDQSQSSSEQEWYMDEEIQDYLCAKNCRKEKARQKKIANSHQQGDGAAGKSGKVIKM